MTANTSSSPAPRQQAQDDEIDLLALFATLWDQKWLIAAITAVFMVIGIAYALLASPVYRAPLIYFSHQFSFHHSYFCLSYSSMK